MHTKNLNIGSLKEPIHIISNEKQSIDKLEKASAAKRIEKQLNQCPKLCMQIHKTDSKVLVG